LQKYLTYPDNPTKAAEELFIHKNTLFYRIGKIKELFPIDLSNGEERLKIHLTLKLIEVENF
jgi:DNA-binding PucR family transcriptional regulator